MHITSILDLQFGSTGKGLIAGYLAKRNMPDTIVAAWAPNAGHTFIEADGTKHVNIAVPTGIVSPRAERILIGPGSVINPELLQSELQFYTEGTDPGLDQPGVFIHEHAAVVLERHREAEAGYGFKIGSTMKGVGEAVIEKIRRGAGNIARTALKGTPLEALVVDHEEYLHRLAMGRVVQIEGAQGYSLGINSGFHPYVTSRECTLPQLLMDCGVPYRWYREAQTTVVGVARTFPIRVANRYKDGVQVGTSGPCYQDQFEIDWREIGKEPELTTVTRLPRRLFTFSATQVREAIAASGVDHVFLNFVNYYNSGMKEGLLSDRVKAAHSVATMLRALEDHTGAKVRWIGWGASENDVEERAV